MHFDTGDVAVKGPQFAAALTGHQFQQGGLADQGLEFDVGVFAQGGDLEAKAVTEVFDAVYAFGLVGVVSVGAYAAYCLAANMPYSFIVCVL